MVNVGLSGNMYLCYTYNFMKLLFPKESPACIDYLLICLLKLLIYTICEDLRQALCGIDHFLEGVYSRVE